MPATPEGDEGDAAAAGVAVAEAVAEAVAVAMGAGEQPVLPFPDDPRPGPAIPLVARPASALLREAVADPRVLVLIEERVARPALRLADLLSGARKVLAGGGGAEEALWHLWEASGLARRLAAAAGNPGAAGRAADRDLDAVVALFDALARGTERRPRAGVAVLLDELEAQEIPAQSRAEGALTDGDAVRLLTAHRSKGLEWELVVVAGVQEEIWPDLRRRASLLHGDRLSSTGVQPAPTPAQLLAEERRLFYVALTRARTRLVITAVDSGEDGGDRPSRFLDEIGVEAAVATPGAGLLTPSSLVGRLRRSLHPDANSPRARAAAAELARLATAEPGVAVPAADPDRWWGVADVTPGAVPVRPSEEPVALSASAVSGYLTCPLQWFLRSELRAAGPDTASQGFGQVVHVLARLVSTGAVAPEIEPLMDKLDVVWHGLAFDSPWQRERERENAREALEGFLRWHRERDADVVGSEVPFDVVHGGARLRGSIDRVELDADGRAVVLDYKTGSSPAKKKELAEHPQLGVYQLAVREGGVPAAGPQPVPGGAALVQLRNPGRDGAKLQPQPPLPQTDPPGDTWVDELVQRTAVGIVAESFPARVNDRCQTCAYQSACPAQDAGGQVIP